MQIVSATFMLVTAIAGGFLSAPVSVASSDGALVLRDETLFYNSKPFSGSMTEHFPGGEIFRRTQFLNGLRNGVSIEYGIGGTRRSLWNFSSGRKEGLQQGWFLEGPKRFEEHFRNGVLHGIQTEWHLNGNVFRRQTYVEGVEQDKKILYAGGEVYSNYRRLENRIYGRDGGPLCFEPKREGEK